MTESHARAGGGRRLPVWLWIAAGVLAVGVAATVALLMGNRGGGPVPPEAEVVTLPVPTPTVSAIDREPGSAFFDALPSEVLAFALAETAEAPDLVADGALEAYTLTYTDGSQDLMVQAGQWPTAEEAQDVYAGLAETAAADAAAPTATPTQTATDESADDMGDDAGDQATEEADPGAVEEGPVLAGGQQVGRYTLVPHADGTGLVVWTNETVVLTAAGPLDELRDVYVAFPL